LLTISRSRALVAAAATTLVATLTVAAPAAAAPNTLAITEVAFSPTTVDTTGGPTVVNLGWTITNGDTAASIVVGVVELRRFEGSTQIGPAKTITFGYNTSDAQVWAAYGPMVEEGQRLFDSHTVDELEAMAALLGEMTSLTDRHREQLRSSASREGSVVTDSSR